MSRVIFVSSSDHNYFPMLLEWVHSIRSFNEFKDMDIGIMNAGMTQEQVEKLRPLVTTVVETDWPCDNSKRNAQGRAYLKACVNRPFIPELFPQYDFYIWMDGDTWLQDKSAVDQLLQGAEKSGLAIVPQTHRAYGKSMRIKWLGPIPWKPRSFYYSNAKKAFSGKIARQLFPYATLNAGVFAITGDAPHWKAWQSKMLEALKKGKVFTAEQLSLGVLVYLKGFSAEFLPATCNWLCESVPLWDKKTKSFVEPFVPYEKIGIMHLSGLDEIRLDRSIMTEFATTDGGTVNLSYRYPDFDGETVSVAASSKAA